MDIVFFGSDNFAVPSLKALLSGGYKINCVVTQPDRKKGRGLFLGSTAIKTAVGDSGVRIYQPEQINTSEALNLLKDIKPDLFVVIAYGQILSQGILDIPRIFSINVHASLLPKYRGAAPINWAIIKGEKTTGISIIKMVKQMDAGPIILQKVTDISDEDTAITLEDKLSRLAADSLLIFLKCIEDNNYQLMPQGKDNVSLAPKLKKKDGWIDWNKPACDIYNLIRGCIPWPGTFTYYKDKLLKVYKAKVILSVDLQMKHLLGEILEVSREGITIATGKDNLLIEELQIEGKRRMKAQDFIAGHKICVGEMLGSASLKK